MTSERTSRPAFAVRLTAAAEAGRVAARLRLDNLTPDGHGNPDAFGAYQWADASGFNDDPRVRSFFTLAFIDELARAGVVADEWGRRAQ